MFMTLIEQLGLDSSFFVMMGLFVFVFFLNWLVSFGSLSTTLVERDKRMAGREEKISGIEAELNDIQSKVSESMKVAQKDASARFADLKSAAVEKQRDLFQEARSKATETVSQARDQAQSQLEAEGKKISGEVDLFAKMIVERIAASSAPGFVSGRSPRKEAT